MARNKRIGVLWLKESRDGKMKYFSGYLDNGIHGEDIPIAIFKAIEKLTENSPDYVIVRSAPQTVEVPTETEPPDDEAPPHEDDEVPF